MTACADANCTALDRDELAQRGSPFIKETASPNAWGHYHIIHPPGPPRDPRGGRSLTYEPTLLANQGDLITIFLRGGNQHPKLDSAFYIGHDHTISTDQGGKLD